MRSLLERIKQCYVHRASMFTRNFDAHASDTTSKSSCALLIKQNSSTYEANVFFF